MSNADDFIIENGVLKKYVGPGGDVVIPEGVSEIGEGAFIGFCNSTIHVPASVQVIQWNLSDAEHPFDPHGTFGKGTTICAPTGSVTEREVNLKRVEYAYRFIAEGTPVSEDDSAKRCERSFHEWRKYFNFSNRAKGSHVSAYLRSSKLVYLPDNFGKPLVASLDQTAFPEDTAVICSKRLFAKLAPANKAATVQAYLSDHMPFSAEERKYLTEYIKKNAVQLLGEFVANEKLDLLKSCLLALKNTDDAFLQALDAADCAGKPEVKAFLLNYKNEISAK